MVAALSSLVYISVAHASGGLAQPARVNRAATRITTAPPVSSTTAAPAGQQLLDTVNAARRARGLPSYRWDGTVARAAQAHADDMAARQELSHRGSDGSDVLARLRRVGLSPRGWGETLAAGFPGADTVVEAWLNSPAHRPILLSDLTVAGAALATSRTGTTYWTLVVAD